MQAQTQSPSNRSPQPLTKSGAPRASRERSGLNRRRDPRFQVNDSYVRMPCRPFPVVDAAVRVPPTGLLSRLWPGANTMYDVLNLSKGGVGIETDRSMKPGQRLVIELFLPGQEEPFELSTEVRWQRKVDRGYYEVGLKFAPFSRYEGANPRAALDAIRRLEAEHIERFGW